MKIKAPQSKRNRLTQVPDPTVITNGTAPLRIDLGCGKNKREGFIGADRIQFPGVDVVADFKVKWPWPDNSVDEAHASHVLEHFNALERVHFVNELFRVLKPGSKATIIVPHWSSCRAYGDPTHCWPPVSEFAFYYWKKDWRMTQAPHTDSEFFTGGFTCNFDVTWGYSLDQNTLSRNIEYQQFAITHYKEVCQDIMANCTKPL